MTDNPPRVHIHNQDNVVELSVEIKVGYIAGPELIRTIERFVGQQVTIPAVWTRKRSPGLVSEQFGSKTIFKADTNDGITPYGFGLIQFVHRAQAHRRVDLPDIQHQANNHTLLLLVGALALQGLVVRLLADSTM
jgi:hypothetical protein